MEGYLLEWSNLLVRWLHFIVGVAWIGASFYFNWLENHLERKPPGSSGVAGSLWAVHGGGFYYVQKYEVAPEQLPTTLHWFKWEAYLTWISGMVLLFIVYYIPAGIMMASPTAVIALPTWGTVLIGLSLLFVSWFVYDALCKSRIATNPALFTAVGFGLLVLLAWFLTLWMSGRAAFLHVGAAIGTIMVANVFFVIIPSQKDMVAAMSRGEAPDGRKGKNALLRSRHNNYLTLPVLFIMVSHHFPSTFAHTWNWLVLAALMAIGAAVRHYFNIRHQPERKAWILPGAAMATLALAWVASPAMQAPLVLPSTAEPVAWERVSSIVSTHCTVCHAAEPIYPGFSSAPAGLLLETEAQILQQREAIQRTTVLSQYMPPGNLTGMAVEERAALAQWIAAKFEAQTDR
jgi:uncharacterized membrane protein